ncbi:MAG: NAD(P)H-hydrate dehydratase [Acidobacteria bacterium]|nr:NAD(P)H-hydrate dehydratase [Acidobacteriota bacterium]
MKILTAEQMQRIDRISTERYGVPSLTLMENAGRGIVEFLESRFAPLAGQRITILCGRGNNGGDGMVVARLLRDRGLTPRVLLFSAPEKLKGDALVNWERLFASGAIEIVPDDVAWKRLAPEIHNSTLLIDALLGTGLTKPLEGFLLDVVRDVNGLAARTRIVAVDLPSGISADQGDLIGECVRAHVSVTFTAPKLAHVFPPACECVGEWVVKPIGTPAEALSSDPDLKLNLATREDLAWLAAPRARDAHKGRFGHVLILAGSIGKTGAAAMAASAALRAGAGLVTIATARSALPIIASLGMEYMTEPLPETDSGSVSLRALDYGRFDELVNGKNVLAVGPGLGSAPETFELVRAVAGKYELPVVIDADGLNAFAGRIDSIRASGRVRVLTPHPGEMARLTGQTVAGIQASRLATVRHFAASRGATVVLKGHKTLTAAPEGDVWVNSTGNPGMASGGTGDVLTGLIAGLLAQHNSRPPAEVAAAAVYLHGLAGDIAAEEAGETSLIAGDVLDAIPAAFRSLI